MLKRFRTGSITLEVERADSSLPLFCTKAAFTSPLLCPQPSKDPTRENQTKENQLCEDDQDWRC